MLEFIYYNCYYNAMLHKISNKLLIVDDRKLL